MKQKILITGAKGQLGTDIVNELNKDDIYEVFGIDRTDFDLVKDFNDFNNYFKNIKPDICIHCAAYTQVDKAETDEKLCMEINYEVTKKIADICKKEGSKLIFFSTDYVFDGNFDGIINEDQPQNPLNIYGKSKAEAEKYIINNLINYFIIRISWVFGKNGKNFVETISRLAKERDSITVVDDQIGSPTYTIDVAKNIKFFIESKDSGIVHLTNTGYTSFYDWANKIVELQNIECKVLPIKSKDYPQIAKRPLNSRLSNQSSINMGINMPTWQDALLEYLNN